MNKKKLVILTGAGISAESGVATFRDSNGLWEGHNIMEVASPEGWKNNKQLVLDFYNKRRAQLDEVEPNSAHIGLAELESDFEVVIITQNVDDLHERGGSSNIIHLHGELKKVRSENDESLIYDYKYPLEIGQLAEDGNQLRPHIVWFGEDVPEIQRAIIAVYQADIFVVIGTSLNVYPAAGLIQYTRLNIPKFIIDVKVPSINEHIENVIKIEASATEGVNELRKHLSSLSI